MKTNATSLLLACPDVLVVAHREDTSHLESTLRAEGFRVTTLRGPYSEQQLGWSASCRCLVNHSNAWREIERLGRPAIVVEADFVPVRDFGSSAIPRSWLQGDSSGFGWLYSAGSVLYGMDAEGAAFGHGNTTVAYVASADAARALLRFYDREVERNPQGLYSTWETRLGPYLRWECGIRNHLPVYQFGEHGGLPSGEHASHGVRPWHQADVLLRGLSFLPAYAKGSVFRYALYRTRAVARGWGRFLALKFFDPRHVNPQSAQGAMRLARLGLFRLLHLA